MKTVSFLFLFISISISIYSQGRRNSISAGVDQDYIPDTAGNGGAFLHNHSMPANDSVFWVVPSTGYANRQAKAPCNHYQYQRGEYLVKANEILAGGLLPGSIIGSIGFWNMCGGVGSLSGTLQIFMKNTTDTSYTLGDIWNTAGFKRVLSDSNYLVETDQCVYTINLDSDSLLTYSGGGLYIAWEFSSPTGIPATVHVFHGCNAGMEALHYGGTGTASLPNTLTASKSRPATFLTSLNNWTDRIRITNIYTLEKMPIPYSAAQPVGVRVKNVSATEKSFQLTCTIIDSVTSEVQYTATQSVVLSGDAAQVVDFTGWYPEKTGKIVYLATTSNVTDETFTLNNNLVMPAEVNGNVFSYNYNSTARMSWGWTWPGDGIFATRFQMGDPGLVNGAYFKMSYLTGSVGNKIKTVVLDSNGTILGESAEYVIRTEDLNKQFYLPFNEPVGFSNERFYVGLYLYGGSAQWYGLTAGFESPLRPGISCEFPSTGGQVYEYTADEINSKWLIDASVTSMVGVYETAGKDAVKVYPNPASDKIFFEFTAGSIMGMITSQVCDLSGKTLITREYSDGTAREISLAGLAPGLYVLKVNSGALRSVTKVMKVN